MSRFTKSFSINYTEGENFGANRLVKGLAAMEEDGRGAQVLQMRRWMLAGMMLDEVSKGLVDALLNMDDSDVFRNMDKTHQAEIMMEMIRSDLAQRQRVDAMINQVKSAQPTETSVTAEPANAEPAPVESEPVQEPQAPQRRIMAPATIFS